MPWVVGIDEAGYGPNLGPLVQAAVSLFLPDSDPAGWDTLKPVVRRAGEKKDGRLLIDDSKKVYTRGGLKALELGVWSAFSLTESTAGDVLRKTAPWAGELLAAEPWFDPLDPVPVAADPVILAAERDRLRDAAAGVTIPPPRASLLPPMRFNQIVDGAGSKGVVLACGLVDLLKPTAAGLPADGEPLLVLGDQLGGRRFYAGLIQQTFPDGWVVAECESADESRYRVERLDRPVTVVFRPRADAGSVSVALASMLAKYLREVCMLQFNRFWAKHVPGIQPTAGYPVDAKRFYAEIGPAMAKLGLTADQVWRKR